MESNELESAHPHLAGVSRRDFITYCSLMAVSMGLPISAGIKIAEAVEHPTRPPVIWLSFQECTGCVESLLRANHPTLEQLILNLISLDYSETLCAAAGQQAEDAKELSITRNRGKFILVVDGAVPTRDNGIHCKIGGKTGLQILNETAPHAAVIVAMGSCASWGGVAAAAPNPTGAKGIPEILGGRTIVTIPGCPPSPYNLLSTILYYLTYHRLPELDAQGRPKFAYSRLIHENCERRPHFDAGRFALQFGDDLHRTGACLYKLGCKGPQTHANCPSVLFGDVGAGSWPVGTGHPCFGCTEKGIGFSTPLHTLATISDLTPPTFFSEAFPDKTGLPPNLKAFATGTAGLVIGAAGAAMLTGLGKNRGNDRGDQNSGSDDHDRGKEG